MEKGIQNERKEKVIFHDSQDEQGYVLKDKHIFEENRAIKLAGTWRQLLICISIILLK